MKLPIFHTPIEHAAIPTFLITKIEKMATFPTLFQLIQCYISIIIKIEPDFMWAPSGIDLPIVDCILILNNGQWITDRPIILLHLFIYHF
jgi:hypothetical protein